MELFSRKLATLDELSSLVFHVALDNTLVINEVSEYTNFKIKKQ